MTPPGVDALQVRPFPRSAVPLEVPPRNAVLRGKHDGVRAHEGREQRRDGRQPVRLHGQHDDVGIADLRRVVGGEDAGSEVAVGAAHRDAALPHRRQVRPSRNERDVLTREAQLGAQIRANSPRAIDRELHSCLPCLRANSVVPAETGTPPFPHNPTVLPAKAGIQGRGGAAPSPSRQLRRSCGGRACPCEGRGTPPFPHNPTVLPAKAGIQGRGGAAPYPVGAGPSPVEACPEALEGAKPPWRTSPSGSGAGSCPWLRAGSPP